MAKLVYHPDQGNAPLWSQIAQTLREEIEKGVIKPGEKLPPEMRLAHRFGVNRHTLRQAIQALSRDGVVRVERGRGTFAQHVSFILPADGGARLLINPEEAAPFGELQTLSIEETSPGEETRSALKLKKASKIMRIETAGLHNGRIAALMRHAFPLPRCEGLCERISDLNSVFEALAELDFYDYCRKSTQITAEMPEAEIAGLLQIPPSRPVLKTIVTARSQVGLPLEYSRCWYAADLCSFALGEA